MHYIRRKLEDLLVRTVKRGKSVLLLGPRQTGKSTLLARIGTDLQLSLVRPDVRQTYERRPETLAAEVEALERRPGGKIPLVAVDEVQKVPELLNVAQDLIDRNRARFILTGSSARKLRRGSDVNLLPGRVVSLRLDPFSLDEYPRKELSELLYDGALPGIVQEPVRENRTTDLHSYAVTYLEEEVRAEALVRNLGSFGRFLELAAAESGHTTNMLNVSQDLGIARQTVASYYEILEDCLIVERIDPLTAGSTRKRLAKSARHLFFDLGVRRVCAHEATSQSRDAEGRLFEQMIGLELLRHGRLVSPPCQLHFWKDLNGPEVDWVVRKGELLIPVEVKMTSAPSSADVRHLATFLSEFANAPRAWLVCCVPRRRQMTDRIVAIPWQETGTIVD